MSERLVTEVGWVIELIEGGSPLELSSVTEVGWMIELIEGGSPLELSSVTEVGWVIELMPTYIRTKSGP